MNFSEDFSIFILENFDRTNFEDKSFLKECRRLLVLDNSLDKFIKEVRCERLNESLGLRTEDAIIFDIDNIRSEVEFFKEDKRISEDFNQFFNFLIFQTIIHETRHGYHDSICFNSEDNSLAANILRYSYLVCDGFLNSNANRITKNSRETSKILYDKFYYCFPTERDAEIFSFGFLLDLWKSFLSDNIHDADLNKIYYNMISNGYNFTRKEFKNSPLESFYKVTGNLKTYNSYDFSEYDFNTRINFGMPVSKEEFSREKTRILGI